jgi:hypothetical protein
VSNERNILPLGADRPRCAPGAIRACLSALVAEALESGHPRAAVALASVADLLAQPALWEREALPAERAHR